MDRGEDRADSRLFVGLMLGGIVVVVVSVAAGQVLGADPGTLPDWLAAISTFAALIAATYAAVACRISHTAPMVSAKAGSGIVGVQLTVGPGVVYPTSIPITISNASPVPVCDLAVEVYVGDPKKEPVVFGGRYEVRNAVDEIAVVDTLARVDIATAGLIAELVPVLEQRPGAGRAPSPISIGWSFRDNAGVQWRRSPGGLLEEQ